MEPLASGKAPSRYTRKSCIRFARLYHRYLTPANRNAPDLVEKTGLLKGGEARVFAQGLRVQAYPGPHDPARDTYDFDTPVIPKTSLSFASDGKAFIREVYWPEGHPGVLDFPSENRVGIPATVTKRPLP